MSVTISPKGNSALAAAGPAVLESPQILTDSNGSPIGLVGPGGNKLASIGPRVLRPRMSNAAPHAPYGYGYTVTGGGLTTAITAHIKHDVEAGYDALQVVKFSNQLKAGDNWKCVIAGTETSSRETSTLSYTPIVGGVSYNTLRNGTSDLYGWDPVTFGGKMPFSDVPCVGVLAGCAFTVTSNIVTVTTPEQPKAFAVGQQVTFLDLANVIPAGIKTATAGTTTSVSFAQTTANGSGTCNLLAQPSFSTPGVILSDLIDSHSIPRGTLQAADIGQSRSLVMMRTYYNGAANTPPADWQNITVSNDTPTAANRGRITQLAAEFSDCVGTLSNMPNAAYKYIHPFYIIPYYDRASISVAIVGDSTFHAGFLAADKHSNWLVRACADVSTPDLPVVPLNLGMGSATSAIYQSRAKTILSVLKPDIAIYEAFSPNDSGGTQPSQMSVWGQQKRIVDFLKFCAENGIYPILTTPLPMQTTTTQSDAFRLQVRAMVLDIAKSRQISYVDFGFIGDGATPERFRPEYNDVGSPLHQNEAAMELQAAAVASLLRQLI